MREIKFRGKRTYVKNGKFIYGSYLYLNTHGHDWSGRMDGTKSEVYFIVDEHDYNLPVDPKTVGQYTGLKDKIGKEIYEGDILRKGEFIGKVEFHNSWGAFCISNLRSIQSILFYNDSKSYEVIGNIYENPELLEG